MTNFFSFILDFFLVKLPTMLQDLFLWILKFAAALFIKLINVFMEEISPHIINAGDWDLDIIAGVISTWNGLPSQVINIAVYCNIPQMVSIITTAYIVVFVRRRIPFFGK